MGRAEQAGTGIDGGGTDAGIVQEDALMLSWLGKMLSPLWGASRDQ